MVAILGEYEAVHLHCALMPFHSLAHLVQLGLQCQVLLLCLLLIVLHTSSMESPSVSGTKRKWYMAVSANCQRDRSATNSSGMVIS